MSVPARHIQLKMIPTEEGTEAIAERIATATGVLLQIARRLEARRADDSPLATPGLFESSAQGFETSQQSLPGSYTALDSTATETG